MDEQAGAARPWLLASAVVVAAGALLRLLAARGDLWLDEIWSLDLARGAGSAGDVFFGLHHYNNHYLNTLWLLLLGPDASALAYRLLAVAAGTATLVVAAAGEARRDRSRALLWLTLLSSSYLLVHYSSEARGYGLALLFAVACYASMERLLETRRAAWSAAFAAAAVLGFLSHLSFLYPLLAFLAWGAAAAARERGSLSLARSLALALAPPLLAFGSLWAVDLRHLVVGGAPDYRLAEVLRELVRTTFGIPPGWAEVLGLPILALAAAEVARMARERDLRFVFFAVVFAVPAAILVGTRPEYVAPRFFLVVVPFLLWLVASGLARLARQGRAGAGVATLLVALFAAGNATYLARLLRDGRGHYREALELIVRSEPGRVATVGSDHDFRNALVMRWHVPRLPGAVRLAYVQAPQWNDEVPTWVLRHHVQKDPPPGPAFHGPTGRRYDLVRVFPYAGLSGWDWYLYRMAPAQGRP